MDFFGEIVLFGMELGLLCVELFSELGLGDMKVILFGLYDMVSVVMVVLVDDFVDGIWCYISSGIWSLMGVEVEILIVIECVCEFNFMNEVGVGGMMCLLKNIGGFWLF